VKKRRWPEHLKKEGDQPPGKKEGEKNQIGRPWRDKEGGKKKNIRRDTSVSGSWRVKKRWGRPGKERKDSCQGEMHKNPGRQEKENQHKKRRGEKGKRYQGRLILQWTTKK